MIMNENSPTRRSVLGTVAGSAAILAGCADRTAPETSGTRSDAIKDLSTGGYSIEVSLTDSVTIDSITTVAPSGTEFNTQEVATGATRVEIEIGTEYDVGNYDIIAIRDGTQVDKESIEIRPNLTVREVIVGSNYDGSIPDNLPYAEEQALLTIENSGFGPDSATDLSFSGGVPNPTEPNKKRKSGIYDSSDGYGAAKEVAIPADGEIRFWSTTRPFLFTEDGVTCASETQEKSATVDLEFGLSGKLGHQIDVQYTASESSNSCDVSITQG